MKPSEHLNDKISQLLTPKETLELLDNKYKELKRVFNTESENSTDLFQQMPELILNLALGSAIHPKEPNHDLISDLITLGANANGYLFRISDVPLCKLLISKGANPNVRTSNSITPLHLVENTEIATILLDAGANIHAKDYSGETPLFYAGTPEMIALFIANGANVNERSNGGSTPIGTLQYKKECLIKLIEQNADINALDNKGKTALDRFREYGVTEKYLEHYKASGAKSRGEFADIKSIKGLSHTLRLFTKSASQSNSPAL